MPDATKRPIAEWREKEWLQHLQRQAQRLTACPHHADDLAHTCLIAFYDHHRCYPWQHPEPAHALRWCCQKLRALACDAHRYAQRHPCLALETLPESVACVDIAAQVQGDIDGERFVASLPPRLRAAVELRLAGYSWDEAAQQLGVSASTLRGYLPELRAKFVDFFGYDPSKRASESLLGQRGKQPPQMIEEETQMKAILGLVNGLVTTRNTRGGESMNAYSIPAIPLQPYQELAVRFALNRFLTRYRTPCHDRHEWRVECLREAICAVLCADADEPPTTLSALGLDAEDGILVAQNAEVQGLWVRLSEAERERVLWLARQAENALKRYWRQEHRFYGCTEALVMLNEEGEWVEWEIENREALDALEAVLEQLYTEQLLERLWERLDQVERVIVAGLKEGKTQGEIAHELEITQSAVAHRLQKIRAKAQAILAEMGENRG
jgi:DNA-directed RNA polymerase specialized sigma24 family protein